MDNTMKENIERGRNTGKGSYYGKMDKSISESLLKEWKRVMAHSHCKMALFIKECLEMTVWMGWEYLKSLMEIFIWVYLRIVQDKGKE